jgi:hypothetical protein
VKLRIANDLALPPNAVTETFAILGRRGRGKTNTATVLAEEMIDAGAQVIVIDPTDAWWGLRLGRDGKSAGKPVVIFGGSHADLPLPADSGRQLADLVVDEGIRAVFSVRHLSKSDARRWVGEFGERLYDRKGEPAHRTPLHLVIDEADAFIPQRILPGGEKAYGAIDTIVRRGRSSGIGTSLISQRPAVIAKDVLTQTEVLVCHQTAGPQDRKALLAWVEQNDDQDHREEFLRTLASLDRGVAWFWSPGLLRLFKQVHVRARSTFDSSATPGTEHAASAPTSLPNTVDLDRLREKLATTIERAKEEDPKTLRRRIAELERKLAASESRSAEVRAAAAPAAAAPVLTAETVAETRFVVDDVARKLESAAKALRGIDDRLGRNASASGELNRARTRSASPARARVTARSVSPSDGTIGGGLRRILVALAQRPQGLTNRQIGIRAGLSSQSGTFATYLSRARSAGWIEGSGTVRITPAGIAAIGEWEPLPTGEALATYWIGQLNGGAARMLRALVEAYPAALTNAELGARAEVSHASGTFATYLSRLRGLELVEGRGEIRASKELVS